MERNKIIRSVVMAMLVVLLVIVIIANDTAITTPSKSGTLEGMTCGARVEYVYTSAGIANGVKAVTTFGSGGKLTATTTVYYKKSGTKYTKTVSNTTSGGGAYATAYNNDTGNVYGGKGVHKVVYGDYTWSPSATTIGTTW